MKKMILFICMVGLAYPVISQQVVGMSNLKSETQRAQVKSLGEGICNAHPQLWEAMEKKDFKTVIRIGKDILEKRAALEQLIPPGTRAAVGYGVALPDVEEAAYCVRISADTKEYVVMAQILKGEISLAQAIKDKQNADLLTSGGYFAYLTGHITRIFADFMISTETFLASKKCKPQIQEAFEEGLIKFDAAHECED